jgi:hypothetical protein
MCRSRFSASSGFSLVDALVAGGILSVGVLALAQLFVVAIGATSAARRTTLASILAAQKMEELRAGPLPPVGAGSDRVGALTRDWTVTPHEDDPEKLVIIRVAVAPGGIEIVTLWTKTAP